MLESHSWESEDNGIMDEMAANEGVFGRLVDHEIDLAALLHLSGNPQPSHTLEFV